MSKYTVFCILTLNFGLWTLNYSLAQNKTVDSLLLVLKTAKEDTDKVNALNSLFLEYEFTDTLKAKKWLNDALELSKKINYKRGIGNTNLYLGFYAEDQGNYPEALKNHFISLKIRKEIGDKKGIAGSYNNIGTIYENQGNYPEALKNYFASLKIKEEIRDKSGIAGSYNNIGNIYFHQGNYAEALKNYLSALRINEELKDKKWIAFNYNNIGIIYCHQGKYSEALKNHLASLKIEEEIRNKEGIADSYNNIGNIYYDQGNYSEALKNHLASLKIEEEIGYKRGIAASYNNIGNTLTSMNRAREGKSWQIKSLALSKEIGAKYDIKNSYSGLAQADSALGNYKSAFESYKMYVIYRDSLINEENTKKTLQASMQYEYDKKMAADSVRNAEAQKVKDALILAQTSQIKQEQTKRYGLYGGLTLVMIFSGFIFNRFVVTRKQKIVIEIQKTEVEKQRELADSRRVIAEGQKEVIAIKNKEIIDSINYAKRIQNAMLTSETYIAEELQKLNSEYFIIFKPKDIVSGDFYWFHKNENALYYMTADCTGHGVPGGFMSMLGINLLNEIVIERGATDPGKILNKLREEIIKALTTDEGFTKDGMDGILCKIDYRNQVLEYSASNNSPYLIRGNQLLKQSTQKMPIGFTENSAPFVTHVITLQRGDAIYTFTDGLSDQFGGEKSKKFLTKNIEEKLLSIQDKTLREQKEILNDTFENWKGKLEQVDDITIIGLRV